MVASVNGRAEVVFLLLQYGANVHATTKVELHTHTCTHTHTEIKRHTQERFRHPELLIMKDRVSFVSPLTTGWLVSNHPGMSEKPPGSCESAAPVQCLRDGHQRCKEDNGQ